MTIDFSMLATMFGIIATLITGAVWVMSLVNKITARATSQEKDIVSYKTKIESLEKSSIDYDRRLINVENNIINNNKNIDKLLVSIDKFSTDLKGVYDELHKLANLVNNNIMEKAYLDKLDNKLNIILKIIDEKD